VLELSKLPAAVFRDQSLCWKQWNQFPSFTRYGNHVTLLSERDGGMMGWEAKPKKRNGQRIPHC